jgi:hypothetical protein
MPMQFEELVNVVNDYIKKNENKKDFITLIREFSFKNNMSPSKIYKKAYMDRRIYSAMMKEKYHPSKKAVISIGLALKLNYLDMKKLLESAGFSFSNHFILDLAIMCCIKCGIYNLDIVNALLVELGEKSLNSIE